MDGDVESGAQASPARDPEKQVRCDVRQLPSALARVSASAADKADVMPMPARPTADAPRRGRQALERAARRLRRSHPRVVLPRSELGPGAHCAPRCLACATPLPCIARRGLTPSGDPARSLAQELQCGLGLWGSVGLSLGCMQPLLSACVFQLGFANGGPRTVIYGFILCFLLCLPLALSMAEIASVNINAGGIYYFAGAMSGRLGKVPAFVSGWVYTIAAVSGTAAISLQAMQQAVSIRMIYSYGFESSAGAPSSTQQLQFCFAVALLALSSALAALPQRAIDAMAKAGLVWLLFATLLIVVCLPAIAKTPETSRWVWTSSSLSQSAHAAGIDVALGSNGDAYTFLVGLLPAQFLLLFFDIPCFMSEETVNAPRTVPRAIMLTFLGGGVFNLALLLAFCYSITKARARRRCAYFTAAHAPCCMQVDNLVIAGAGITGSCPLGLDGTPVNHAPGGCMLSNGAPFSYFAVGNVIYDAFASRFPACGVKALDAAGLCVLPGCCDVTGAIRPTDRARDGAVFFCLLPFMGVVLACANTVVGTSRFVYAFARDGGYPAPLSRALSYVSPATSAPTTAVVAIFFVSVGFAACWLNVSPTVAFAAVTGIGANGVLFLFGLPCLLRATVMRRTFKPSAEFSLGRMSVPCALIGALCYGAFSNATIALPALYPTTVASLNFAPVALGAAIVFSLALFAVAHFLPDAVWCFVGPQPSGNTEIGASVVRRATFARRVKPRAHSTKRFKLSSMLESSVEGIMSLSMHDGLALHWLAFPMPDASPGRFGSAYTLAEKLQGSSKRSKLWRATHNSSGLEVAVKVSSLTGPDAERNVLNEIQILRGLSHPNCLRFVEWFSEEDRAMVVTEYVGGGEVLEALAAMEGTYTEADACAVMRQLLAGLSFLHSKNLVHRNLKLENLLLSEPGNVTAGLKLSGFHLARLGRPFDANDAAQGTPAYCAPEQLGGAGPAGKRGFRGVTVAVDMWSAGVIMHTLLVGFLPFESEDERELFSLIRAGEVSYDDPAWDAVSPTAQKLVAALLVVAPTHRQRAREAAAHAWFATALEGAAPLDAAQQKLRSDVARRRFQKTVKALQAVGRMARLSRASTSSAAEEGAAETNTDSAA